MLTFVELAARKRPRWVVWENVPGVLSSNKGGDFASFLGLLTGRDIQAPVGGWTNSGCIEGISSAYGVAWTMLDAQDFGVAQRRKRIFVIGYLGDWRPPAAVLFERNRLQGDTTKSREKRKATSADAQGGVGGGSQYWGSNPECSDTVTSKWHKGSGGPAGSECGLFVSHPAHAFKVRGGSETATGEQGGTPGKKAGKGYLGQDEKVFTIGTTQDQQIAQPIVYENHPADSRVKEMGETCQTVSARFGTGGGNVPLVQQPIAVDCYNQTINHKTTQTIGSSASDVNHYGAVLQPIPITICSNDANGRRKDRPNGGFYVTENPNATGSLTLAENDTKVLQPVPYRKTKRAQSKDDHETWVEDDKANTINTFDVGDVRTTQAIVQPTIIDRAAFNQGANAQYDIKITQGETMSSLVAKGPHGVATNTPPTMAIRRLLPVECEKLQGFPPKWTEIPYRGKPADQCPDGPRYKACGNSMAVPCMAYLGRRIQMVDDILNEQYNGAAAIPQF
jgi:DNA (cytosine-5)-methyltransferase 1